MAYIVYDKMALLLFFLTFNLLIYYGYSDEGMYGALLYNQRSDTRTLLSLPISVTSTSYLAQNSLRRRYRRRRYRRRNCKRKSTNECLRYSEHDKDGRTSYSTRVCSLRQVARLLRDRFNNVEVDSDSD